MQPALVSEQFLTKLIEACQANPAQAISIGYYPQTDGRPAHWMCSGLVAKYPCASSKENLADALDSFIDRREHLKYVIGGMSQDDHNLSKRMDRPTFKDEEK